MFDPHRVNINCVVCDVIVDGWSESEFNLRDVAYNILSGCHGNGMPLPHPGETAVSSRGAGRESREMRLVDGVSIARSSLLKSVTYYYASVYLFVRSSICVTNTFSYLI